MESQSLLAERVIREKDTIVFLEANESGNWSRWIVFPDRETLLWHFKSDSAVGFKATDMKDYFGWKGAGILVSAEGEIIP